MKKITYILGFFAISFLFVMLYYGTYYYAKKHFKSEAELKSQVESMENPALQQTQDVAAYEEEVVKKDTNFQVENYHIDTKKCETVTQELPVEYIGMNRQEMIDYLSSYEPEEENLSNVQLVSFSSKEVVIRKSYTKKTQTRTVENKYWILEEDGLLIVYKQDKETIYIRTGISISKLSAVEQSLCRGEGIPFENIHDLYRYLESCTS